MFVWFIVAGIISGIVAGAGMGGGTLLIPILTIFLGVTQKNAQGLNLLAFLPMAIVALIIHLKNKLVKFGVGIPIIISGVLFSCISAYFATKIPNEILRKIFGWFLILVALIQILIKIFKSKKPKNA